MTQYILATDGGCRQNPGAGSCAYILQTWETDILWEEELYACRIAQTTNNRAELEGLLRGVKALEKREQDDEAQVEMHPRVTIICDSLNVINWVRGTFKINEPAIGALVYQIQEVLDTGIWEVAFQHVHGHTREKTLAHFLNARCDAMCTAMQD
jgi:ribonuclease HI